MKWILPEIVKRRNPLGTLGRFLYMSGVLPGARLESGGSTLVMFLDRIRYEAPRETLTDEGERAWRYPRTWTRVEIGPIDPRGGASLLERVGALAGHLLFGIRVTSEGMVELRTSAGLAGVQALPATLLLFEDIGNASGEATALYLFGPAARTDMAGEVASLASA